MSWFTFPWSRNAGKAATPRVRLQVEILEDRTLPATFFVVPAGTPLDGTHFATLQAALSGGLSNGDIVQIEPGSSPGNIAGLTLPSVSNLTIQGDPAAGLSSTPLFTLSDTSFTIAAAQAGFTLKGVNIGLIQGSSGTTITNGTLTFNANGTITGSNIVDISSAAAAAITFNGTADVLSNSTVADDGPLGTVNPLEALLEVTLSGTATSNLISANTFAPNRASIDINYAASAATTVTDQVVGNTILCDGRSTFISSGGVFFGPVAVGTSVGIEVSGGISGLTIADNAVTGSTIAGSGIELNEAISASVLDNTVDLSINILGDPGPIPVGFGINVQTGTGTVSTLAIVGNRIQVGGLGGGLGILLGTSSTLNVKVEGNDFQSGSAGVDIQGTDSASGIDLGGGSQGSLGGNDFRGFAAVPPVHFYGDLGAIATGTGTTGTVSAQHNIFSVADPSTAVTATGAAIDTSKNLTGNAAFVETLYIDFLHRAGDTTKSSEAGYWVNQLNSGSLNQSQVANDILRSPESLRSTVNGLYQKLLGRPADSGGLAYFVNLLETSGTIEQVTADLVSSAEYAALTGSDGAFVQSLYVKILGRVGSNAEVAGWLNALPSLGRAAVAQAFLHSTEFRGDAVEQLYGDPLAQAASIASLLPDLLHRTAPPSSAEINGWVNSGLDVLSLEAAFAGTGEFFTNG